MRSKWQGNSSNTSNSTYVRIYTNNKKFENNYYRTYINRDNSSNSSNSTTKTYVISQNYYAYINNFYYGQNETKNTFSQDVSTSVSNYTSYGNIFIRFYTINSFYNSHFLQSNETFNNSQFSNSTILNLTMGDTIYSTINSFATYNYYNYPNSTNDTNRTNSTSNYTNQTNNTYNSSNYINNSDYSNNTYINNTRFSRVSQNYRFRNSSNQSNSTNVSAIVENFINSNNNYYWRFINFTNLIPCYLGENPYCISNSVSFDNYTTNSTYVTEHGYLVRNISHYNNVNSFFKVYYNRNFNGTFVDVRFNASSTDVYETEYISDD